jgi:hypothetical protein
MTPRIEKLEDDLLWMRAQTWGTAEEQARRKSDCWRLSGHIEDLKKGRTPRLDWPER